MALLSLQNIALSFGERPLLEEANLQIERGERVCILGRNGAGKSSLLKIAAGELAPDSGIVVTEKGTRITRLAQEIPTGVSGTVREVVRGDSGLPEHEIDAIISRLDLNSEAEFSSLSGGLKRRAWLGRALAGEPDVLLLDEPTNHLDIASILWLEEFLKRHVRTLLFITHDRAFLRALATRIVEIDRAQLRSFDCSYDQYLERKEALLHAEEHERAIFDKKLKEEEVWIRRGVEARRTKSQARIRDLMEMRALRRERRNRLGSAQVEIQSGDKSGRLVAELENVSFSYDGKPVVRDFSTIVMRGDKIGVIGPNGSGKTTLLKLIVGELEAQSGVVKRGTNLQIAYFDQMRAALDENQSAQWNVAGENSTVKIGEESRHIVGYLQEFLFEPDRIRQPVRLFSGGERNRLLLAKLFTQPANLLIMDEPTNDLDLETLEVLENLLVEFKGTLLLVSHDRAFLNDVVTSTLVFEGDGQISDYAGGYDDYLRQRPTLEEEKPKAKPVSAPREQKAKPRKLSFKEARELENLPQQIEKLEGEQANLAMEMSDPNFYASDDGTKSAKFTARLGQIETELSQAFTRWEELLEIEKAASE